MTVLYLLEDHREVPFKVLIDEEKWIEADAMIIATMDSAKWLGLESEQWLKWIWCECLSWLRWVFLQGERVAIVGAGDTAVEEALNLSKLSTTIQMFIRRDVMQANIVMQERAEYFQYLSVFGMQTLKKSWGDEQVQSVRIKKCNNRNKNDSCW